MLVFGVLLFSLILVRAPVLLGDAPSPLAAALTQAPFAVAICVLAMGKGRWRARPTVLLATAYVTLLIVAAFRGSYFETISVNAAIFEAIQFTLIATLAAFAFLREGRHEARRRYLVGLCWAAPMYVAVNVLLHFAGYRPPGQVGGTGQAATVLNVFGVSAERVVFPMAGGFTGMGPAAAIAFAVCAIFALRGHQRKLAIVGAAVSLYTILVTDSRGALLFALTAVVLVALARGRKHGFGWVAVVLPVLPFLLALALSMTADTVVAERFDRIGGESISTGTGRTVVWEEAFSLLSKPRLDNVFGYGEQGQLVSGVSVGYAYLFSDPDPLSHSAHSLVLQTALDVGWAGLACLIAAGAVALVGLARRGVRDPLYAALLSGALAVLLLGTVQAAPTPVHPDSLAWWLMVLFVGLRVREGQFGSAPSQVAGTGRPTRGIINGRPSVPARRGREAAQPGSR